jgi:Sec-independent protein translocase protein TatA
MISVAFLLLLGLIIFGPKKTMEIAQDVGRMVAQFRHAVGQFSTVETIPMTPEEVLDSSMTRGVIPLTPDMAEAELSASPIQLAADRLLVASREDSEKKPFQ